MPRNSRTVAPTTPVADAPVAGPKVDQVIKTLSNEPTPEKPLDFDANRAHTKDLLALEPKVRVRLRQSPPGEEPLPDEIVGINGWNVQIMRGVDVEVPESIYQVLLQANRI